MNKNIIKILRFAKIYGPSRTFIKAAGRLRFGNKLAFISSSNDKDISIVGCGQFAFSTIGYFLKKQFGDRFLSCYDINYKQSKSLGEFYGFKYIEKDFDILLEHKPKYIYVASNHHSHTDYAIQILKRNIDVYIEKPISVTFEQFKNLQDTIKNSSASIYAGYNRPFSGAIQDLTAFIKGKKTPMSINYFISGHKIGADHWYRDPKEGTRICGNVGHWLDLTIHLFALRGQIPEKMDIAISYSSPDEPDDNFAITLTTELNDIVTIMLTSRSEPFEGINETINIQCDDVIAKIDDFRSMVIWKNEKLYKKKYWPKDVGHKKAIMQPFEKDESKKRNWYEVELSTILMLHITDMVLERQTKDIFMLIEKLKQIKESNK